MKDTYRKERLKDRKDYRQVLIQRKEELDAKLQRVEEEIRQLKD